MTTNQYQYVPARTNHLLHMILSFCTFGFWVPIWITVAIYNHNRTVLRTLPPAPPQVHPYLPGVYGGQHGQQH